MRLRQQQRYDAKRAVIRAVRLANHAKANPDHYGDDHDAELARRKAFWATLDDAQRAEAVALVKSERDAIAAAHPQGIDYAGVGDLTDDAIAQAIATLEG